MIFIVSKREGALLVRRAQYLATVATQVAAIIRTEVLVEQLQSASTQLESARTDTVVLLAAAAEAHDRTTGFHLQSVRSLTESLAREMRYTHDAADALGLASVLHDIGKIRMPEAILARPGKLPPNHGISQTTHRMGRQLLFRPQTVRACRDHRPQSPQTMGWRRLSGWPSDLDISEAATIVNVADAFDAMTHDLLYRAARPMEAAMREIVKHAGGQFNPAVVGTSAFRQRTRRAHGSWRFGARNRLAEFGRTGFRRVAVCQFSVIPIRERPRLLLPAERMRKRYFARGRISCTVALASRPCRREPHRTQRRPRR